MHYSFPDAKAFPEIHAKWVENVNKYTPYEFVPKPGSRLCSEHFGPNMIEEGRQRVVLKPFAIPTIFPNLQVCALNNCNLASQGLNTSED